VSGTTTPTDEAWKPTLEEVERARKAGAIHLSVNDHQTVCSHNRVWADSRIVVVGGGNPGNGVERLPRV
jgi:hypothetical protein